MSKSFWIRSDKDFATNVKKVFPKAKSFRDATKQLNDKVLEKMLYGKKGSLLDVAHIAVLFGFVGFLILIGFAISDKINDEFASNDEVSDEASALYSSVNNNFSQTLDNSMLFFVVGLSVVALVLAMLVRVHPVFFVFYLIFLMLIIFLAGVSSNVYLEAANDPNLSVYADQLTFINQIMGSLPFLVGVFGFIIAIIMFKNWRAES